MSRFPKKLWLRRVAFLAGGLLFVLLASLWLPRLLEESISGQLKLEKIRQGLEFRGPYRLSAQGVRFDIKKGVVLNGVRLFWKYQNQEEERLLFRAESMILEYSLWHYIRSRPPIVAIHFQRGEWLPLFKDSKIFFAAFQAALDFANFSQNEYFQKFPSLYLEDVRLHLSDAKTKLQLPFLLSLRAQREVGAINFRFQIRPEKSSGVLKVRGRWQDTRTGVFRFQLQRLAMRHFLQLLKHTPTVTIQRGFDLPGLRWKAGKISGKGSIQFYTEKRVGFDIKAGVQQPKIGFYYNDFPVVFLHPSRLDLTYNTGWRIGGNYIFADLILRHSGLQFSLSYRDAFSEKKQQGGGRLKIEGEFRIPKKGSIVLPLIESAQRIQFLFNLRLSNKQFISDGMEFGAKHVEFTTLFPEKKPLLLQTLSVQIPAASSKDSHAKADLLLSASRKDSQIKIQGTGRLAFQRRADLLFPIRLQQDWDFFVKLRKWSYLDIAQDILGIHKILLAKGSQKDAPRAEDRGPLWKQKFVATPVYVSLIEGLKFRLSGRAIEMLDAGGLPRELPLTGWFQDGQGELRLLSSNSASHSPSACDAMCDFRFSYKLALNRSLPRHDMVFYIRNSANKAAFAFLTGSPKPPRSYSFRYAMGGDGWLPGDIVHRSFSRAELEATGLFIAEDRLLKLLNYGAGESGQDFFLDELKWKYGSDGPRSSVFVRARHGKKYLSATIKRRLGESGRGNVTFENGPALPKRSIQLYFSATGGKWRPEL